MSRSLATKALLVTGLVVPAAFHLLAPTGPAMYQRPWITLGVLAFGVFNVLVDPKGTSFVRTVAIACTFLTLLADQAASMFMLVLAWSVWPPAFLVAWALNHEDALEDDAPKSRRIATNAKVTAAAIIIMVAAAAFLFRVLTSTALQQSAALFVGLPAVLAIAALFSPTPRSATGVACKAVTIGLLVSLIFLGEGVLCVAMSAPLFYLVAVIVGVSRDRLRTTDHPGRTLTSYVALLALVPMSLEGVTESMSFNREMSVSETQVVRASSSAVEAALGEVPRFDRALPYYLRAGFPRPTSTRIEGPQDRWVIRMRGGEMRLNGMEPRAGDLVLVLEESRPGLMQWRALSDDSHMTHFLDWRSARVEWEAIDAQTTRVTWTLRYRRRLDPAWYFGPMEEYATHLAARYLIESVATP